MPERLECEVLQKVRYINTLTFAFYLLADHLYVHCFLMTKCNTPTTLVLLGRVTLDMELTNVSLTCFYILTV